MTAQELRIGNYVIGISSDTSMKNIVAEIIVDDLDRIYKKSSKFWTFKPIPLTPDIWDDIVNNNESIHADKSGFVIFKNTYTYSFMYDDYKNMHDIQNLYYAMLQKELKINIDKIEP